MKATSRKSSDRYVPVETSVASRRLLGSIKDPAAERSELAASDDVREETGRHLDSCDAVVKISVPLEKHIYCFHSVGGSD